MSIGLSYPHLIACKELEKVDYSNVARFINDSLHNFWPHNDTSCEKVLVFISVGTPYMTKASASLKVLYPNLIHVICLAHTLHRVDEQIRENYEPVNKIVSCLKKIFFKTPMLVKVYNEMCLNLSLPSEPVQTK